MKSVAYVSRWGIVSLVLISCAIAYGRAGAAEKKPTLTEAKSAYAQSDKALNVAWKQIEKLYRDDPLRLATLREKQRRWIKYRDYFCNDVLMRDHSLAPEKLKQSVVYFEWMESFTETRTGILNSILKYARKRIPIGGKWTDGYGGSMQTVKLKDGRIAFEIVVVRGPTHHTGSIAGIADHNGDILRFSDNTTDKYKEKPTWVTGLLRGGYMEIIAANSLHYHGMRAYFDGEYYRVGDLTAKEKAELIKRAKEDHNRRCQPAGQGLCG